MLPKQRSRRSGQDLWTAAPLVWSASSSGRSLASPNSPEPETQTTHVFGATRVAVLHESMLVRADAEADDGPAGAGASG